MRRQDPQPLLKGFHPKFARVWLPMVLLTSSVSLLSFLTLPYPCFAASPFPLPSSRLPSRFPRPSSQLTSLFPRPSSQLPSLFPLPSSRLLSLFLLPSSRLPSLFPHPSSRRPSSHV